MCVELLANGSCPRAFTLCTATIATTVNWTAPNSNNISSSDAIQPTPSPSSSSSSTTSVGLPRWVFITFGVVISVLLALFIKRRCDRRRHLQQYQDRLADAAFVLRPVDHDDDVKADLSPNAHHLQQLQYHAYDGHRALAASRHTRVDGRGSARPLRPPAARASAPPSPQRRGERRRALPPTTSTQCAEITEITEEDFQTMLTARTVWIDTLDNAALTHAQPQPQSQQELPTTSSSSLVLLSGSSLATVYMHDSSSGSDGIAMLSHPYLRTTSGDSHDDDVDIYPDTMSSHMEALNSGRMFSPISSRHNDSFACTTEI